jgi:hypothetical protein
MLFDVFDIVVHHSEEQVPFVALQSFDDELIIGAKEEKAATCAGTFTRLEDFISILRDVK